MTLILTMISPLGIIHVSDSNLSYADGSRVGVRRKKPYKKLHKAIRRRLGPEWRRDGDG